MLTEQRDHCPYCGEPISLLVDCSEGDQSYIEDCQVCCRPIQVRLWTTAEGEFQALALYSDTDII